MHSIQPNKKHQTAMSTKHELNNDDNDEDDEDDDDDEFT